MARRRRGVIGLDLQIAFFEANLSKHRENMNELRLARFMNKVDKTDINGKGCWLWTGFVHRSGYGLSWNGKEKCLAHRLSYEHFVGPIPAALQLDHLCRVRRCVNPQHLEPVTQRENLLSGRGLAAKNARKTHCVNGHEFTKKNSGIRRDGNRYCRECLRLRNKRKGAANGPLA